ncbi:MAG: N-acetylmuramoyl-L-alanine amidase [Acidimicrobiia bacterium]
MRSLMAIVVALVLTACSFEALQSGDGAVEERAAPTTATSLLTTTTTTAALGGVETTTTTTIDLMSADAIITPTGVVVAVLDHNSQGIVVRSPCGNEKTVSTGTPVGGIRVVLDPGHGGETDTGAVGANGLAERDLNLRVARAVEAKLGERGIGVVLTRTGNYASTLETRSALADQLDADILVSIHHNAPTPNLSSTPGTEVFIQTSSAASKRLGGLIYDRVVEALAQFDIQWAAAPDSGVLIVHSTRGSDAYGMIRNPDTVSVLAELGYISHPPEAELFATSKYVDVASGAVADGIEAYLETGEKGSGYVDEPRVFTPNRGISQSACVDPVLE